MKKNKILFAIILNFVGIDLLFAQDFAASTFINNIPKAGFYKINITPPLTSHLKPDFSDFRILDNKGEQVQYVLNTKSTIFTNSSFIEFPIISNSVNEKKNTILILENKKEQSAVSEILLVLKNSSVSRNAKISGSNNNANWFIIANSIEISQENEEVESYNVNKISIAKSTYKFFKIEIDNKKEDPYNIIKAGIRVDNNSNEVIAFNQNPKLLFTQKDSNDKRTYIKINNDCNYSIKRIGLYFSGQKLFDRQVTVFLNSNKYYHPNEIFIKSGTSNIYSINAIKESFLLAIENNDNPPLRLDSLVTYQIQNYAIAYLEAGKQYQIFASNNLAQKPNYDLEKFNDSIPKFIDSIGYGEIKLREKTYLVKKENNKYWIWISLSAAILILALLTRGLLADMKKKNL